MTVLYPVKILDTVLVRHRYFEVKCLHVYIYLTRKHSSRVLTARFCGSGGRGSRAYTQIHYPLPDTLPPTGYPTTWILYPLITPPAIPYPLPDTLLPVYPPPSPRKDHGTNDTLLPWRGHRTRDTLPPPIPPSPWTENLGQVIVGSPSFGLAPHLDILSWIRRTSLCSYGSRNIVLRGSGDRRR